MTGRLFVKSWAGLGLSVLALILVLGAPTSAQTAIDKQVIRRTTPTPTNATRPTTQKAGVKPANTAPASSGFDAARVVLALGAVVGLIFLLRWVAKRFFGVTSVGRSSRAIQVLSRSPLSPRQHLVVLRVGQRLLIVADGGGQMNTLTEITDPDEVAALIGQVQEDHTERAGKSFGALFGKMRGSYEDQADAPPESEPAMLRRGEGDVSESQKDNDPAVASARRELSGLMERVRSLSSQFKGS